MHNTLSLSLSLLMYDKYQINTLFKVFVSSVTFMNKMVDIISIICLVVFLY